MWSLGKVVNTPEVARVYVGSFWDKVDKNSENYALSTIWESRLSLFSSHTRSTFARQVMAEHEDLLTDLRDLPRNAAVRKLNEIVKRARLAKVSFSEKSVFPFESVDSREHAPRRFMPISLVTYGRKCRPCSASLASRYDLPSTSRISDLCSCVCYATCIHCFSRRSSSNVLTKSLQRFKKFTSSQSATFRTWSGSATISRCSILRSSPNRIPRLLRHSTKFYRRTCQKY